MSFFTTYHDIDHLISIASCFLNRKVAFPAVSQVCVQISAGGVSTRTPNSCLLSIRSPAFLPSFPKSQGPPASTPTPICRIYSRMSWRRHAKAWDVVIKGKPSGLSRANLPRSSHATSSLSTCKAPATSQKGRKADVQPFSRSEQPCFDKR